MIIPSGKKQGKKFTVLQKYLHGGPEGCKKKNKMFTGVVWGLGERLLLVCFFPVVSLLLPEKKKKHGFKICMCELRRKAVSYPSWEVQLPVQCTATHHYALGCHGLCYVAPLEGQCSLLLWSKKFPLLT